MSLVPLCSSLVCSTCSNSLFSKSNYTINPSSNLFRNEIQTTKKVTRVVCKRICVCCFRYGQLDPSSKVFHGSRFHRERADKFAVGCCNLVDASIATKQRLLKQKYRVLFSTTVVKDERISSVFEFIWVSRSQFPVHLLVYFLGLLQTKFPTW